MFIKGNKEANAKYRKKLKTFISEFTEKLKPIVSDRDKRRLCAFWITRMLEHLTEGELTKYCGIKDLYNPLLAFDLRIRKSHSVELKKILDDLLLEKRKEIEGSNWHAVNPKSADGFSFLPCNIEIGFQGSKCTCGDMANCAYR